MTDNKKLPASLDGLSITPAAHRLMARMLREQEQSSLSVEDAMELAATHEHLARKIEARKG